MLCLVLLVWGCQNAKVESRNVKIDSTRKQEKKTVKDTTRQGLVPVVFYDDTINFAAQHLYLAKKTIPQFSEEFFQNPDEAYATRGMGYEPKTEEEKAFNTFGCEVCQDDYYLMYAYFLRQRNGETKHVEERKTLIALFRLINSLNGRLRGGGTYFGHQYNRIYAYAEYAVYTSNKDFDDEKKYPIAKEKGFFIGGLKQKVLDDERYNFDVAVGAVAKKERKEELLQIVDQINKLISNHFYLKRAQGFQYSNY